MHLSQKRWQHALISCWVLLALNFFEDTAIATLGEPLSSLDSNRAVLKAVHKSTVIIGVYAIHEDISESGRIRQYVSSNGIVFAVAWNGVSHPDLANLLGSYYDDYNQVQRNMPRRPGNRHALLRGNRVVVEKWGHMRNLQGRAYAPTLLPIGVTTDEIH